jgi:hypothetical protein
MARLAGTPQLAAGIILDRRAGHGCASAIFYGQGESRLGAKVQCRRSQRQRATQQFL